MAKCMLFDSGLDNCYWGEAMHTATYIQNRIIHRSYDVTPYQMWNGVAPNLENIRVFGCRVFYHVPKELRSKLDDKAKEGILMGLCENTKGYRILASDTKKITVSRDVVFDESLSFQDTKHQIQGNFQEKTDTHIPDKIVEMDFQTVIPCPTEEIKSPVQEKERQILRRSERSNKGIPASRLSYKISNESMEREPSDWDDMQNLDQRSKELWLQATNEEMVALKDNETWELVTLPPGKKPIGCKWIFKVKRDPLKGTCRYRARLVAKGFSQKYGENYDAVFAPVVRHSTIRTLFAIAAKENLKTIHMDVRTAFLYGEISKDIYMTQPQGYLHHNKDMVCKLKKSLYGLKQSARVWNIKINDILIDMGFERGTADQCLYHREQGSTKLYVLLYVDDLLICGSSQHEMDELGRLLGEHFDVKDLGPATCYLGLQVERSKDGSYLIHQKEKITEMLDRFGMSEAKGVSSPMEKGYITIDRKNEPKFSDHTLYRQVVGTLLYIATISRLDIAVALGYLARKVSDPLICDWKGLKRIMRYLKSTIDMKIKCDKTTDFTLTGYTDAEWGSDTSDRKSIGGCIFMLGSSTIFWSCRKQNCVSLSSTEAEYVSAAHAAQDAVWLRELLHNFGYSQSKPTRMFEDNQACIKLTNSEGLTARSKHIDIRYHYLRDLQQQKVIDLIYCPTEKMLADVLTKPLSGNMIIDILNNLNIKQFELSEDKETT